MEKLNRMRQFITDAVTGLWYNIVIEATMQDIAICIGVVCKFHFSSLPIPPCRSPFFLLRRVSAGLGTEKQTAKNDPGLRGCNRAAQSEA
jgi:hypothetical protein